MMHDRWIWFPFQHPVFIYKQPINYLYTYPFKTGKPYPSTTNPHLKRPQIFDPSRWTSSMQPPTSFNTYTSPTICSEHKLSNTPTLGPFFPPPPPIVETRPPPPPAPITSGFWFSPFTHLQNNIIDGMHAVIIPAFISRSVQNQVYAPSPAAD